MRWLPYNVWQDNTHPLAPTALAGALPEPSVGLSGKPKQRLISAWLPQMVFSSSCTVYGNPSKVPIDEAHPLAAVSPYGRTKLIIEEIFRDYSAADPQWRTILLRYFNPVGAHPSGPCPASLCRQHGH